MNEGKEKRCLRNSKKEKATNLNNFLKTID